MTLNDFLSELMAFPTSVFFVPFLLFLVVMLIDLVFNVIESATAELDLLDLDNLPGSGLLLPPVLSKVPLMVALCSSFFVATVLSFYTSQWTQSWWKDGLLMAANLISVPFTAYVALVIAAWFLKPLSPLFDKKKAFAQVEYVGLAARVHSSKVTSEVGEVMVVQNGNEYLLDAVTEQNIDIEYGDEVVIVAREAESRRYVIAKK
ncbi:DUF1449 domain-containing protein [Vibrio coralliilyticus]|uniref:DUF1449 domain-containing protein n=1 Tax=Vibrio coralliilyticus TaxID=190893 RepID=UPI0017D310ED|nr:DUF1449 domain-containing protein [Vibrio coralliilyticus]NUW67099.1 DUF1449 domain-containing protein [Vibrio coralliilyticus]